VLPICAGCLWVNYHSQPIRAAQKRVTMTHHGRLSNPCALFVFLHSSAYMRLPSARHSGPLLPLLRASIWRFFLPPSDRVLSLRRQRVEHHVVA